VLGDVVGGERRSTKRRTTRAREGQEERDIAAQEGPTQVVAAEGDRHAASNAGARRGVE